MRDSFCRKGLQRILGSGGAGSAANLEGRRRPPFAPRVEELEWRLTPAAPVVLSINRTSPALADTSASSIQYTVTFDKTVTGVDAADFKVATNASLSWATPVVIVAGSGASYVVTVDGIRGSGDLRLDLIDNDSIVGAGHALGDAGSNNGSFQGQTYAIHQALPPVVSIERTAASPTNAANLSFTVTFDEPVSGVDATDFTPIKTGTIGAAVVKVTPVSTSVYTVTINGVTGDGTLGLNLVNDGSIRDAAGNPLAAAKIPLAFAAPANYATGNAPKSVTVGDVNLDGKPDLAVANTTSNTVSVLLNNGDGTFQPQKTFAAGLTLGSVTLGDVNGDGKPDLVVTSNSFLSTVSVLLGNGDGTFQAQQAFPAGSIPNAVTLGDVNGDGKPDLAVVNQFVGTVSVLLNNGDGTFAKQPNFATGSFPASVTMGDVNEDGKADLAVGNSDTVSVFLGNGNGTFQTQQTFATGNLSKTVTLGDVNGDGKTDLVISVAAANVVGVLLGNGDGAFQAQQTFATGNFPNSVALGDVNGDGRPDLATSNQFEHTVSVLLGNGNGSFQKHQTFMSGIQPYSMTMADMNGDGMADLTVGNANSGTVSVVLSKRTANIGQTYTVDHSAFPAATATTLTATASATTGGSLVTITAAVTSQPPAAGVPFGTVRFLDGANSIGVGTLDASGVAVLQVATLTPGPHSLTAVYVGANGFAASTSNAQSVVVTRATPPTVVSVTPNGGLATFGSGQRSRVVNMTIVFDQPVALDPSAITLALHTNTVRFNGALQPSGFGSLPTTLLLNSTDKVTWVVTFDGNTEDSADGYRSLKDGIYDLKIDAAKVHPKDAPGVNMDASKTTTFHRLFGDTDPPATPSGGTPGTDYQALVNTGDNLAFRAAFGKPASGGYQPFLDFNGDGFINSGDNLPFRSRFNKALTWRV